MGLVRLVYYLKVIKTGLKDLCRTFVFKYTSSRDLECVSRRCLGNNLTYDEDLS